jgi:flagellar motor switch protein FliM
MTRVVRPYDFRRPDRLSKEQLGALSALFGAFGRFVAPPLGALLRSPVQIAVSRVDQQTYEELAQASPLASCVALFQVSQLGGRAAAIMGIEDAAFLVDILLGGTGERIPATRALGETDRLVLERFFAAWPVHLRAAWRPVTDLQVTLEGIEGTTEFVHIAGPQDTMVLVHLELSGLARPLGIRLVLPHMGLQPLLSRMSAASRAEASRAATAEVRDRLRRVVLEAPVRLRAELPGPARPLVELGQLRPGDVIRLGTPLDSPVSLLVGSHRLGLARIGAVGGVLAVQLVSRGPGADEEGSA